ncbi:hypothetical protein E6C70_11225 [Glaciibacter flavus]|uniref:Bacterial Ig-like domain-containing protein n=1 Tax=Orlajensenia flava TaxID=2565934 RepID=A0A4V3WU02_9MICO|nr:hypothetical protein [Glaciibacter flavus]THG33987.1 hypothetical protein E6C70_11225 [Glaciibacter flavus]
MEVTANPSTVAVGEVARVTATGLGGLETAGFGLSNTDGASLSADGSTFDTSATSPVTDGSAQVYFKASEPGTYAVDVTDGESPIGDTTITVTADAPAAGAQLTASPGTITAGQPVTITASNLGGLATANFGLGGNSGDATLDPATATVTDGTATTTFTASEPGTYIVDVTDGETPLASTQVTVTGADPAPSMTTTTPSSTPTPAPTGTPSGSVPSGPSSASQPSSSRRH